MVGPFITDEGLYEAGQLTWDVITATVEDFSLGFYHSNYQGDGIYQAAKIATHGALFEGLTFGQWLTHGAAVVTSESIIGPIIAEFFTVAEGAVATAAANNLANDLKNVHFDPGNGGGGGSEEPRQITRETDMADPSTWPEPPGEGPFTEGAASRPSNARRGEKSFFDAKGGEWRPHRPDKWHEAHWDYKPAGESQEWINIDLNGKEIPKIRK